MTDCIFCKIVKGDIPSSKVFETPTILAFLDINPVNKGHVLIIPKDHVETLLDIPEAALKDMVLTAKKVGKSIKKAIKADGFNLGMNNFSAAGQEVMHAHLHVIPRYTDDGLTHWPSRKYDEGEIEKYKEMLTSLI